MHTDTGSNPREQKFQPQVGNNKKDAIRHRQPQNNHACHFTPKRYGFLFAKIDNVSTQSPVRHKPVVKSGRTPIIQRGGKQKKRCRGQQRQKQSQHTKQERQTSCRSQHPTGYTVTRFTFITAARMLHFRKSLSKEDVAKPFRKLSHSLRTGNR